MKLPLVLLALVCLVSCADGTEERGEAPKRVCRSVKNAPAEVDTNEQLPNLKFRSHTAKLSIWNRKYDERYFKRKKRWVEEPLKVIVVPHSTNSYLKEHAIDSLVDLMTRYPNMTFTWNDLEPLDSWWKSRGYREKKLLKSLVESKRLEITTGSRVLPDQGLSSIFGLVNTFTEGHQWLWTNLKVVPQTSWNPTDPGFSPSVSYIMKRSGVSSGAVINKIQSAWKERLAELEMGDFMWRQGWDVGGAHDLLTHHHPYDSLEGVSGCGPFEEVCSGLNFKGGVRTLNRTLNPDTLKIKAELFLSQAGRTASLFPHNVVLFPIGGYEFFDTEREWADQYYGLNKVFDFINKRFFQYHAHVGFGTSKDYFNEVRRSKRSIRPLTGDFFPYFNPNDDTGFFSGRFFNRPYLRGTVRYMEAELRTAEILFTLAFNYAQQLNKEESLKVLESFFEKLYESRAAAAALLESNFLSGLVHDNHMFNYNKRTQLAIQDILMVQSKALEALLIKGTTLPSPRIWFIHPMTYKSDVNEDPYIFPLTPDKEISVVVFNSLLSRNRQLITIMTTKYKVLVKNSLGVIVPHQITPFIIQKKVKEKGDAWMFVMSKKYYYVHFYADLMGLSLATYKLVPWDDEYSNNASLSKIQCHVCTLTSVFKISKSIDNEVKIENSKYRLVFDNKRGLLQKAINKETGEESRVQIKFGLYGSPYSTREVFHIFNGTQSILNSFICKGIIITGSILSKVTIFCGDFLEHSITLHNTDGILGEAIGVESMINALSWSSYMNKDFFMRVETDISNGVNPEFFTDSNGLQTMKRRKLRKVGLQGNYYPLTSYAFIQDDKKRLTMVVDRSQGVSSWWQGRLEVVLDRYIKRQPTPKTLQKYWLLLESVRGKEEYQRPSHKANQLSLLLKYPASLYYLEDEVGKLHFTIGTALQNMLTNYSFLAGSAGCDVHLVNLRTQEERYSNNPLPQALLTLHRMGVSCAVPPGTVKEDCTLSPLPSDRVFSKGTHFNQLRTVVQMTSLTGTIDHGNINGSLYDIQVPQMELSTFKVQFL